MKALDRPNWLWLVAALVVVGLGVMVLQSQKPPPPPPPLPNPNGYDDFLKAAQVMVDVPPEVRDGDLATLAAAVEQNKEALRLVRLGLSRECRVPVQFSEAYQSSVGRNFNALRSLRTTLAAEGRLAERQGCFSNASVTYLDCIRLGNNMSRGGLVMDKLITVPADLTGLDGLQRIRAKITPGELRGAIETLQLLYAQREPIEDIIKRDNEWTWHVHNWWENLSSRWEIYHTIFQSTVDRFYQSALNRHEVKFRLGILDLAIQHHHMTTGYFPTQIRDLVPTSISKLPEDPFNSGGFIYRTNATGYLLYSIGPDGKDDGGAKLVVPANHGIPTGDVLPQ